MKKDSITESPSNLTDKNVTTKKVRLDVIEVIMNSNAAKNMNSSNSKNAKKQSSVNNNTSQIKKNTTNQSNSSQFVIQKRNKLIIVSRSISMNEF